MLITTCGASLRSTALKPWCWCVPAVLLILIIIVFPIIYTGYISLTKLATADIYDLMDDLTQALPWIGDCVNKIDVTNIGQQHDLIDLVRTEPLDLDAEMILQEPAE